MKASTDRKFRPLLRPAILAAALLGTTAILFAQTNSSNPPANSQSSASNNAADSAQVDAGMTKLRIRVTDPNDKPVGNASVYVRYYTSGGFLRHEKLQELNFKTNQDGSVKVPEIPQGKILIQVIAKGWHTYGKWYDIAQSEQSVPIKLDPPPHWY
ncbi:MAG TPA: carboxypeptidase-like regulatory domain-containing protein [Candidatus Acidoferrales bacterium]|jgi:hypothetical protein|nr:carboxypeptidase-like regulatory domain-containing protein [Candidatus Acidoferrales bacterium]